MVDIEDLISDSDSDEDIEWYSDGDWEAGSLNAAGSSALFEKRKRNLDAPGPSTLVRLDSNGKKDSGPGPSDYMLDYFVGMGFTKELVLKAISEVGNGREDSTLDLLLTYKEIDFDHLVDDHSPCYVPHTVDDDDDILENWDDDDDAGDNSNKGPNSDDSSDQEFLQQMSQRDKKVESLLSMGFPEGEAKMAIARCGQDADIDVLVELICRSGAAGAGCYESYANNEEFLQQTSQRDKRVESLVSMGFPEGEAKMAIARCGQDADIDVLVELICRTGAAGAGCYESYANNKDTSLNYSSSSRRRKRTKFMEEKKRKGKQFGGGALGSGGPIHSSHDELMPLPNPMVGFSLPGDRVRWVDRRIPKLAIGPPFFYYENVALAPKGVWPTISSFLYDIQPEFVDSKFFCATARKRGYVHNLPIENRLPLIPLPPKTIHDAFPRTKQWWPSWDTRRQFNCLQTCVSSSKLTERIRCALANREDPSVQKYVLEECRKWNLLWVGRNKVTPLEPDEMEFLLGFPKDHTRGISRTERYRSLGNSFQVDTVAYHLSVLRDMFPNGLNVLSLFSGIGGAEVALDRLGIRMKTVVSVEKSELNRTILKNWWEQTQSGTLIEFTDIQNLTSDWLEATMRGIGGFDLVIGGSPCNNLAGSNRYNRDGLDGEHSSLFYHYHRILEIVKSAMRRM